MWYPLVNLVLTTSCLHMQSRILYPGGRKSQVFLVVHVLWYTVHGILCMIHVCRSALRFPHLGGTLIWDNHWSPWSERYPYFRGSQLGFDGYDLNLAFCLPTCYLEVGFPTLEVKFLSLEFLYFTVYIHVVVLRYWNVLIFPLLKSL